MSAILRPFFSYYGGKWRIAPKYPRPKYDLLVEPFAGSAGYALRHFERQVVLYDANPTIVALWRYLIVTPEDEIAALPLLEPGSRLSDVTDLKPGARALIGFWLNAAATGPRNVHSAWYTSVSPARRKQLPFWREGIRDRICEQVRHIRHWQVYLSTFRECSREFESTPVTWFIDPPYEGPAGRHYPYRDMDYLETRRIVETLPGQRIVCEQFGASWAPFVPFVVSKTNASSRGTGKNLEAIWYMED